MRLILYSKPGCHLCEGLQEKLEQIQNLSFELEIRDITTREDWFAAYQYEVPVLYLSNRHRAASRTEDAKGAEEKKLIEEPLPRPSPRASVQQLEQMLRKYLSN
ncbi:glutaredoxin family protein [Komarekiella sp. 'clone 1']|uniref:Glutaredoxin family protein n=1 Tax=Komarekiella delphini-convector SJRDD-AB1 TaxID=2593771 RepID=A0AA40VPG2_9NOST|nr:glutaredoxin family protein [Komarekiella delphini-convector]MBD6614655.1 glutaredoxin family protein [Komarekiella delphini-convector SJRDD-AB1]